MIAARMPDNVLLVIAEREGQPVAAAMDLFGAGALYGRYWGSVEHVPGLHFEACYYQALEFCIERGIALFEGGAQGEHKHARGFLPEATRSFHWLAHPPSSAPSTTTSRAEGAHISEYIDELGRAFAVSKARTSKPPINADESAISARFLAAARTISVYRRLSAVPGPFARRRRTASSAAPAARRARNGTGHLAVVRVAIEPAADQLEAQVEQVGVRDVGLAVRADRRDLAALVRRVDLRAVHAELAGKPHSSAISSSGAQARFW
jgi:hypothetical protein